MFYGTALVAHDPCIPKGGLAVAIVIVFIASFLQLAQQIERSAVVVICMLARSER